MRVKEQTEPNKKAAPKPQRYSYSLPSRARERLGGAMPTDLLDLLGPPGWCSGCWPHDGEVAGGAVASSF